MSGKTTEDFEMIYRVGQYVRVTFTDKYFEVGQSLDCQIAAIMRKNGQNTLLFNTPRIRLFLTNENELSLDEWEFITDTLGAGVILARASEIGEPQFTGEWTATVEPLSSRELG
jgi:hypothetical protein